MSRPPPPGEPSSPPQPQTRKRCLKRRDEGEPLSNLRRTAPARQKKASAAIAKTSDSDAQKLSQHKRKPEHGLAVATKYSPNRKSFGTRFQGRIAHGSGGCFSPAVGKGALFLGKSKNVEDLNVIEGYGDSEDNGGGGNHILSGVDFKSLPRTTGQIVPRACSHEAKSEEVDDPSQQRNGSIDVRLLIKAVAARVEARAQARVQAQAQVLADELIRMEVAEKRGDDFFVSAVKYLSEKNKLEVFMALCNDNLKWIYLKRMKN